MFHFRSDTTVAGRLLVQMNHKEMHGSASTDDYRSILTLRNKCPLLAMVCSCANMLTMFLPNGASRNSNTRSRKSAWYLCPILTQFESSRQNCNKISHCKISQTFFTFAPCMLLHLLYLKPTHALILNHTYASTFIKTLKLVKMFCKSLI
jgi:hypothetical protein